MIALLLSLLLSPPVQQNLGVATFVRAPIVEPAPYTAGRCTYVRTCADLNAYRDGVLMCDSTWSDYWLYIFFADPKSFFGVQCVWR